MSSLKVFASVAILTLVGGYGLSRVYDKYSTQHRTGSDEDKEPIIVTTKSTSSPTCTNASISTKRFPPRHNKSSISKKYCIIIEDLIINITTKQSQAVHFRKKYHRNLNEILKQIDELREKICVTEAEHLKKIHHILDEIENHHKHQNIDSPEDKSHIKELEKQVVQAEAYLDTELRVLQADLGMLMWKYEELDNYALKEWKNSQLEIQQLRTKLMKEATQFSRVKANKY